MTETIHDVCKQNRVEGKAQEDLEYTNAKAMGVEFFKLSDADMATLRNKSNLVHEKFAADINKLYPGRHLQTRQLFERDPGFNGLQAVIC